MSENVEKIDWAKNINKVMTQMQMMMKEKGMDSPMDYVDLSLNEDDDLLPRKFKFLDMKKYTGTDDHHLY